MEFENTFVVRAPDRRGLGPAHGRRAHRALHAGRPGARADGRRRLQGRGQGQGSARCRCIYKGDVEIVERDAERARGVDARQGEGGARAGHRGRPDPHGAARAGRRDRGLDRHRHADERQGRRDGAGRDPRRRGRAHGHLREEPRRARDGRRAGARRPWPPPPPRARRRRPATGAPAPAASGPVPAPRAAAPPPGPARPPGAAPPAPDAGLPVGQVVASVVAGRLQDPRARAVVAGLVALLLLRVGIAIGRRR